MLVEQKLKKEVKNYITEDLSSSDMKEIRRVIRIEVAEIFFDLFRKRSTWV